MTSPERRQIDAARGYILKLRSMHPSTDVLVTLDEAEQELDERERRLEAADKRTLEHA
ncbi:hypothetical protein [Cellulomonas biazotea]|uniref:Uncharacterized protein n=1 Tax=Cellulomonas biazotea TaxID=1709 RepID=A0A402DP76_9CELL|nr:hypothetical protein [Cellulomonas biazotea]GCE75881.1 hypothetical protein CBZ_09370 [Cellulomonas biazotea]